MMDDVDPTNSWCVKNCGLCFEVCTTGGSHTGASHTPDECITIQIENRYEYLRHLPLIFSPYMHVNLITDVVMDMAKRTTTSVARTCHPGIAWITLTSAWS